ncbi:multiple epidermal growth factor-like domains protein 10 [Ostrea edulis]|uniref:multiple epidermal growth factor-like domains protein 10 n=1 Tax=Ostrea edulis TaxID=37623 RepID=UPI0024AE9DE4|nr:multiple epidermal growth factor-like domains protein 10 [Ostrea edulis]
MKSSAFLYIQVSYFIYVQSYDQLVRPGVTEAVSSSVGWGGYPNKTVDGDRRQRPYTYCMHTAGGKTEAWLRVDLGGIYNLKSVKLWYRNTDPGRNTERLRGFSIRLTNTITSVFSDICYQDPGNQTLPAVLEIDCRGAARYVWFYTKKDNNGGVFLEICEVEIYGCPEKHFGEKCIRCDDCGGRCDEISGQCQCLKPGYQPPACNKACEKGLYGSNCVGSCGHCQGNKACEHVNGSCRNGHCEPGWKHTNEWKCNQECDDGHYGLYCLNNCSGHCADGLPCKKRDGVCPGGCKDGWTNPSCNKKCKQGFYGRNCSQECGHCAGNKTCNPVNGFCPGSCQPGWQQTLDRKCNQDQLVRPRVTEAVSSSVEWGGYPNKTVDGDKTQNPYTYCMHTAPGQREAWLRVDLGDIYNLKSVKIWYRNDRPSDTTKRLQGFSIRLSNTTTPVPSDTCYQDPGNQTLSVVLERECRGAAQYVWFYTNRDNGGGVFLEICEVEVFGCQSSYYGRNCSERCGPCGGKTRCDNINGSCPGSCEPGYKGPKCKTICEKGFYGPNCTRGCGHCKRKAKCDHVNGSCPSRKCKPGWKQTSDRKCDQACEKGFYGPNCTRGCGHCKGKAKCDHVNGACPSRECKPGWKQTSDRKCDQGTCMQ